MPSSRPCAAAISQVSWPCSIRTSWSASTRGRLFRALRFTITGGKIAQVDVIADPEHLRQLDLAVLDDGDERMSSS